MDTRDELVKLLTMKFYRMGPLNLSDECESDIAGATKFANELHELLTHGWKRSAESSVPGMLVGSNMDNMA